VSPVPTVAAFASTHSPAPVVDLWLTALLLPAQIAVLTLFLEPESIGKAAIIGIIKFIICTLFMFLHLL
jgi:hypothetical protein